MQKKMYLGDGVYAEYDGWHIILTTEYGERITNRICLDPTVVEALRVYSYGTRPKPGAPDDKGAA